MRTITLHYFAHPVARLRQRHAVLAPGGLPILEDYAKRGPLARYGDWAIRWYDPLHRRAYTHPAVARPVIAVGWTTGHQAEFRDDLLWRGWAVTGRQDAP